MPLLLDVVIIGVNCAATLGRCLRSVLDNGWPEAGLRVFYVDGGSADDSPAVAESFPGVQVVRLAPPHPSPGLGRNAGWRAGSAPLVQFLDSDTVLEPGWLAAAAAALERDPGLGAACGNRREMRPEDSVYNWIADLEWNPPPGEALAFGGDVMVRRAALEASGGYDEVLVAGEDPDLGVRIRAQGYRILHLDHPMTRHDLAMTRVGQYLRRAFRTGYGFAAVAHRHAGSAGRFWARECLRILVRGGVGPALLAAGLLLGPAFPAGLLAALLGALLLLYPRIFSVRRMARDLGLSRGDARRYAWHCVAVAPPEFAGMARYAWGQLAGRPLRNRPAALATRAAVLLLCLACAACSVPRPQPTPPAEADRAFSTEQKIAQRFASADAVDAFSRQVPADYLLGPGDMLSLTVWHRPELSNSELVVAPDGKIAVVRIGTVEAADRTVEEVSREIAARLQRFYESPEVTLAVRQYKNNKAYILGRVTNPGLISFNGPGTLLEALSLAGGLPLLREEAFLTKCAIFRGRDTIIWIDLRELLQEGNMALNARIRNNDVIFVPESENELVYVLGQVGTPGAIRLKSQLTFLDAVMYSGGPTQDADLEKCFIIRMDGGKSLVRQVNMKAMVERGELSGNFILKDNDIVYVAATGMANINYVMRQILPSLSVLDLGTNVLERFGAMPYLRKQWWGCLDCNSNLKIQGD